jgi:peptide/nickel transport system permease protein
MAKYIFRRVLHLIPILLGVTFLSFLLIRFSPGDYISNLSLDPTISPERISQLRSNFGLDRPWYVQYALWIYRLTPYRYPFGLKWPDAGYSFSSRMPVATLMEQRFWNTLLLTVSAQCVIWLIAIPLALFLAARKNSWIDHSISTLLFAGISMPQVVLCLLALLLAAKTGWFPIGGMHHIGYESLSPLKRVADLLHHLLLPLAVLAIGELVVLTRYARASLLETLDKEFILTARAKGLSGKQILKSHALPNAWNPLLSLLGIAFANLISASFIVEIVMGWPGVARLAYDAMLARDVYVFMGSLLVATVFLVLGNLTADVLLAIADPRIRHE